MRQKRFARGWDEERIQKVLAHYEQQTEEEAVAEDEAMFEDSAQALIEVPRGLRLLRKPEEAFTAPDANDAHVLL